MEFDVILVIALVVMVVIFVQLRSVLGKRIGFEKPPFDPYSRRSKKQAEAETTDNIVSFPHQKNLQKGDFSEIDEIAPEGSILNENLRALRRIDRHFSPQSFIKGAGIAYEMIVTAFAKGDRNQLKSLLCQDVFESFCFAIEQREKNKERIEFTFVGINKIEFVAAAIQEKDELLTVRIISEMISVTYNEQGECIDGDPDAIVEIRDIWTFVRNSLSSDPNWKLFATEDEN